MIIVSLTGPSLTDVQRQIRASRPFADLFEFRLDLINAKDLTRVLSLSVVPFIATCRPVWEGGAFRGREEERVAILRSACEAGASFVDIEFRAGARALELLRLAAGHTRYIVSHHFPEGKIPRVAQVYNMLRSSGADVIKMAFVASDSYHNAVAIDFLTLARRDRQKAVAIAMGEEGEPSRILYRKFGGWATYAATEDGMSAAPGQIAASELKRIYRADTLTPSTRVYGVIGRPLGHSKGVYVHNALFRTMGKDSVYCKFVVADLGRFMKRMAPHLHGFSVTIPHKQRVMRYLDSIDVTARTIGAVNTVVRRIGRLAGTNTDAPGALDAIEVRMPVAGKTMLIVGAGGAARAIAFEAKRRGANVRITNRTAARSRRLARELGAESVSMNDAGEADILVNATSVGMTPHAAVSPVPRRLIRARLVFDAVYNPPVTKLLRDAKQKKARTISGMEMFVNQGARQSRLWTGQEPDVALMRRILHARLGGPRR
jgi:3-dehydroquinate dehydratase / shikimate dehydrogenase